MNAIKEKLLKEYGSFADKRIKDIAKGSRFIVDDRGPGDVGADKELLSYFCMAFVDVLSEDEVSVSLHRNVPVGATVIAWIAQKGAGYNSGSSYKTTNLQFTIKRGEQSSLSELANAIRAIVAPGAPRYDVASYKYVCPRTADSLERLRVALDKVWPPNVSSK